MKPLLDYGSCRHDGNSRLNMNCGGLRGLLNIMKNAFVLVVMMLIVQPLYAAEMESPGPLRKLQRGFLNVALSPMEISNELAIEKHENNDQMPPSWMTGLVRGIGFTAGRALAGVYDIVTFPVPLPKEYGPIIQPELPWEKLKTSPTVQNR